MSSFPFVVHFEFSLLSPKLCLETVKASSIHVVDIWGPCVGGEFPRDFFITHTGCGWAPWRKRTFSFSTFFFRALLSGRVKKKLLRLHEEQREADRWKNRGIRYRVIHPLSEGASSFIHTISISLCATTSNGSIRIEKQFPLINYSIISIID